MEVVDGGEQGVDRHRHGAHPHGAEEAGDEVGGIVQQEQHALLHHHAELMQEVADLVGAGE
jgi:hypothetical protein